METKDSLHYVRIIFRQLFTMENITTSEFAFYCTSEVATQIGADWLNNERAGTYSYMDNELPRTLMLRFDDVLCIA